MAGKDGVAKIACESISIKVDRFQPLLATGCLKGFARLVFTTEVGSISIDNFRLLETKDGRLFVAPPSHKKGEKFYDDVVLDGDLAKLVHAVVKQAYEHSTRPDPKED